MPKPKIDFETLNESECRDIALEALESLGLATKVAVVLDAFREPGDLEELEAWIVDKREDRENPDNE